MTLDLRPYEVHHDTNALLTSLWCRYDSMSEGATLETTFEGIDGNADGVLTKAELMQVGRRPKTRRLGAMMS